jgi:hypothetical protein
MKKWLLPLNLSFSMIGMGQIWLVQLSSYPLWAYVGPHEFHAYHIAWWHSIWGPVFVPAGLALLCTIGLFWLRPDTVPRSSVWAAIALLFVAIGLTYLWWAPLMALIGSTPGEFRKVLQWAPLLGKLGLGNKTQEQLYELLMATHWVRLVLFTVYASLLFWMTFIVSNRSKNSFAHA